MEHANHAAMLEALKRKKAHSLDINIVLGHPDDKADAPGVHEDPTVGKTPMSNDNKDEEEQKELGLAPDAEEIGDEGEKKPEDGTPLDNPMHPAMEEALSHHGMMGKGSIHGRMLAAKHGHGMKKPAQKY